ncbi:hypothetical protein QQZ08_010134 [Neonectria magnoliae]|uniref:Calpain catalytic domain-containing protein n=1 Tax=Neonectria magnoliae TaxID=2732573 RepID=A0ABR1HIK2_9HYPO
MASSIDGDLEPSSDLQNSLFRQKTRKALIRNIELYLNEKNHTTNNEPVDESYNRVVTECKEKLRVIIEEHTKANLRYRDPEFDLSNDLKIGRCLNELGSIRFRQDQQAMFTPSIITPKGVRRLPVVYTNPDLSGETGDLGIQQGKLGNCWLIAALKCWAIQEDGIKGSCVGHDLQLGVYGFVFYKDGDWTYSIVDDQIYLKAQDRSSMSTELLHLENYRNHTSEELYRKVYQTGPETIFFSYSKSQEATWGSLAEKAFAKIHGDYASLECGHLSDALEVLSGGVAISLHSTDIFDRDQFWADKLSKINNELIFGVSSHQTSVNRIDPDGILPRHSYGVIDIRTVKDGTRLVRLADPLHSDQGTWKGPWSNDSKALTSDVRKELGDDFGDPSTFWMPYEIMFSKFPYIHMLHRLRGPNWRYSQSWVNIDILPGAEYIDKFSIRVTESSPLVISLSKIDSRSYRCLVGPDCLTLSFQVWRGKVLVAQSLQPFPARSRAIDLPDVPIGEYKISLRVTRRWYPGQGTVGAGWGEGPWEEKLEQASNAFARAHSKCPEYLLKT